MQTKYLWIGKNKSAILITSIIILSFLSILGMSLIASLRSRAVYSQLQLDRLQALYLAEAGIFKSIWELKTDTDSDGNGTGNISPTKLGRGSFWAKHNFQTSTITAIGEVNKVRRGIQIKYSPL